MTQEWATGNRVFFFPKQITQAGCPQGSPGTKIPPPKNDNTQHNVNSSDPEGLDDMHRTQLYSRAVEYKLSRQTAYVLLVASPHTNLQVWASHPGFLYLRFLRCKMEITIVPTS